MREHEALGVHHYTVILEDVDIYDAIFVDTRPVRIEAGNVDLAAHFDLYLLADVEHLGRRKGRIEGNHLIEEIGAFKPNGRGIEHLRAGERHPETAGEPGTGDCQIGVAVSYI